MTSNLGAKKIHKFLDHGQRMPDFFNILNEAVSIYLCQTVISGHIGGNNVLELKELDFDHWTYGVKLCNDYVYEGHFKVNLTTRTIINHTPLASFWNPPGRPEIGFNQLMSFFFVRVI